MASVLSYLRELNIVTMMLRILLAVLCGGLIGLERERKNRPAGFRTYMLTALGATLTVLLSLQLDQMLHGPWRALAESIGATQDVSRFGAEAAKGIGFLGAGTIIITARPMPDAEQACTELWCFPWDTAIQRARPGKDPFARVFEYLHTALHQQGILLAPPRLVDGEDLPEDHPLSPANIAQMRGSFLDPITKFLPSKDRS